ncbi:hypothetical protein [Actinomadura macrotermitis]|uniref:Uncharacterized protein n=1 Tax=Actinomadura macrotermitis TaxID=2585200 RepID=A0A7K0BWQ4_9ACTN|nr:hypothetical protein [Actinomadura macrotermitis]MQY05597.1 hypothetical protein [Actinomadura macrotermitis]
MTPPSVWLARLRTAFPTWGFVHDPGRGVWTAVRGRHEFVQARSAIELYTALEGRR